MLWFLPLQKIFNPGTKTHVVGRNHKIFQGTSQTDKQRMIIRIDDWKST
jgi:hypothetical protein